MGSAVEKGVYYPVAIGERVPSDVGRHSDVRAVWITGEYRIPKPGDWFLSGAIVEAYAATHDMNSARHIARLVNMKDIHWVVTKDGKPVAVCASENDAERWLQRHQGMSNDWAKKNEGYAITEVNNNA